MSRFPLSPYSVGVGASSICGLEFSYHCLLNRTRIRPWSRFPTKNEVFSIGKLPKIPSAPLSLVVIVLVALLMGFRSPAVILSWLAVIGILAIFTLALTWIAAIAGLSEKTIDGATAFSFPLLFLAFISSAFVPTGSMPPAVRVFAENQPVTAIVDALRALLSNQPVGNDIWIAIAWCVGVTSVAHIFVDEGL
jgi:ABC-2 type transport system permease protein